MYVNFGPDPSLIAVAYGRRRRGGETGDVPTVSLDCMYMHSEQEKEKEKGMPIVGVKDNKTKMVMAKVVPSKGVQEYGDGKEVRG